MIEELFTLPNLMALLSLTALEIVLGIDNIVFLAIVSNKLPPEQRRRARFFGLFLALFARVALLSLLVFLKRMQESLFVAFGHSFSWRDLILIAGGLFLIAKSTHEIHSDVERPGDKHGASAPRVAASFAAVIFQIIIIDLVFSLDSIITAVGMVDNLPIMIIAVVIAIIAMMLFAGAIGEFVERHPTIKMLALSFLLLIGVVLVADGIGQHISKGYIYFAMAFSLGIEMLNMRRHKKLSKVASGPTVTGHDAPGKAPD